MSSTKARAWLSGVLALAALLTCVGIPEVGATEITRLGFLDQGRVAAIPAFREANDELQQEKNHLDAEFARAMRGAHSSIEQQEINRQFSQRFLERQETLLGPLYARARAVIVEIAARKHLSVIVDRRIIIVGGFDVTGDVIARLANPAPVSAKLALPPSNVAYMDQDVVNTVPKVKDANDRYQAELAKIDASNAKQLRDAKTDAERQQIAQSVQDAHQAKQHDIIDPVVKEVNDVIADIAAQQSLALVVDKSAVMTGGRDITNAVVEALK